MLIPKPLYLIYKLEPEEEDGGGDVEEEEMKLMAGDNNQEQKLLDNYDEIADGGEEMGIDKESNM
jgi:hypothetical protein